MRRRRRNCVLESVELLRREAPRMTLSELLVFFYVAENPGINVAELADAAGMTDATASRSARALAGDVEGALPPYAGLIDLFANPDDGRGRMLFVSEKGRALCSRIDKFISAGVTVDAEAAPSPVD